MLSIPVKQDWSAQADAIKAKANMTVFLSHRWESDDILRKKVVFKLYVGKELFCEEEGGESL